MNQEAETIYGHLKRVAKNRQTIFYGDLLTLIQKPLNSPFYRLLDSISHPEHSQGRPLLSAVVVRKRYTGPGRRFFVVARELGKLPNFYTHASITTQFWKQELNRVSDYWSAPPA